MGKNRVGGMWPSAQRRAVGCAQRGKKSNSNKGHGHRNEKVKVKLEMELVRARRQEWGVRNSKPSAHTSQGVRPVRYQTHPRPVVIHGIDHVKVTE